MPDAVGDRTAEPTVEERLSSAVRQASGGSSRLVVLVGEPRRALFLARRVLAAGPPWRLAWTPTGPRTLVAGLRLAAELATAGALDDAEAAGGTLVRLDDLARFLLPADPVTAADAASALRGALVDERLRPLLVLAVLRPRVEDWERLLRQPASGGPGTWAQAQALLRTATVLTLPGAPLLPPPHPATPAGRPAPVPLDRTPVQVVEVAGPLAVVPPPPLDRPVDPGTDAGAAPDTGVAADVEALVEVVAPVAPVEVPVGAEPPQATEPEPPAPGPARPPAHEPSWTPSAVASPGPPRGTPEEERRRAAGEEAAGNTEGAERLYEGAAVRGDLEALARLGRLRRDVDPGATNIYVELALAERNTAVLFTLAAGGHPRALAELRRLQREAAVRRPGPPGPERAPIDGFDRPPSGY